MSLVSTELEQLCVDTVRFLSADAVEKAKSGHPGAPMGAADMTYVLWSKFLRFDPADPAWPGRDRFVLSAGHASMLLYSLLHLFEFDLPLDEIRKFRQWDSRTPGHPEHGMAPGVEATTGPLGQGFANGVGMALAARMARARFPHLGPLLEGRVFGLVSDGDIMEGISAEAASLAGHWKLGNLIYLYDQNEISIEGSTMLAMSEDVGQRFDAYGWHTLRIDGQDRAQVERALGEAIEERDRPSLILARTTIGRGAPTKAGTAKAHGEPLGAAELRGAKEAAGWPLEPEFLIPGEAREHFHAMAGEKRRARKEWDSLFGARRRERPEEAAAWDAFWSISIPGDLESRLLAAVDADASQATRAWSGKVLQAAASALPSLTGGSADLGPSTVTDIHGGGDVVPEGLREGAPVTYGGRTLHFGVREHAMGAIVNGFAYHGGFLPYGATFLVFLDYMRAPVRLAALTGLRSIFVFTHDSVFLGEDGPTHQPIEHVPSLRLVPNLEVWRPADGPETAVAWACALRRKEGPTALVLTRQKLAPLRRALGVDPASIARGGYVVRDPADAGAPSVVLIASGSEAPLVQAAADLLESRRIRARVVSIPCVERFRAQPAEYRNGVIPRAVPRVLVEAARTEPWCELVGDDALRIGLDRFGASAPAEVIARELGFTAESVAERVHAWLEDR
jgi:transketolase